MSPRALLWIATLGSCSLGLAGCYDAEALIQQRRQRANLMRLEEVDLGKFRVTLPPAAGAATHGVVTFHAFGQVANKHRQQVERSLEQRGPELRHSMLMAIRQLSIEQIQESELRALRDGMAEVANAPFSEKLVERIGFYEFSFMSL